MPYSCGCTECIDLTRELDDVKDTKKVRAIPTPATSILNPVKRPDITKEPVYKDDSSFLPFSLNFGRVPEHWTEPDPSTGERKNNSIVELDPSSAEYKEVVDRYFQSFKEGKKKYADELAHRLHSAAGESCFFRVFFCCLFDKLIGYRI
jgi:hypothetical protein